jgi:hypothetical protein
MSIRTITGIFGLILSALGGLWYWRITQLTAAFAGTTMTANLDRTAKFAIALVCFGLLVFLTSMVVSFFKRDDAA